MSAAGLPNVPRLHDAVRRIGAAALQCKVRGKWDGQCIEATEAGEDILDEMGIEYGEYSSGELWGGVAIDDSHHYIVLLPSGVIIDPTIRQFIEGPKASEDQRRAASGYPHFRDVPHVAVIGPRNPFVERMGYESHTTGRGWVRYWPWLRVSRDVWERDQEETIRPWLRKNGLEGA